MSHIKQLFHTLRRTVATRYLGMQPAVQIAITGSQGKTAVTQALYALLSPLRPTIVTDVNLDTLYNVPITALRVRPWHHYTLFELGIDSPNEMTKHLQIVSPTIAVVTGITSVHTDSKHLGSLERLIAEKQKLPEAVSKEGAVFLNYSDPVVRTFAAHTPASVHWYGAEADYIDSLGGAYIGVSDVQVSFAGTSFVLHDHADKTTIPVSTNLIGTYHAGTFACIYGIMKYLNPLFVTEFAAQVKALVQPLPGRMSVRQVEQHIVLDDSLRANPTSTIEGLRTFASIAHTGRKVAILADMGELAEPEKEHTQVGDAAANLSIDLFVCVGTMQQHTFATLQKHHKPALWYPTVSEAKADVQKHLHPTDALYLKGSLYSRVGEVLGG